MYDSKGTRYSPTKCSYVRADISLSLNWSPCHQRSFGLHRIIAKGSARHPRAPRLQENIQAAGGTTSWRHLWHFLPFKAHTCHAQHLPKITGTSWRRNLDNLVTSVDADWIWRGVGGGHLGRCWGSRCTSYFFLFFPPFWTKGRSSLCRPERQWVSRIKGQRWQSQLCFNHQCVLHLNARGRAPPVLTYAAPVGPYMPPSGVKAAPSTFSSVRHWGQSLPGSLLPPLLRLPLRSLSSNSIAIQELRRDPNAAPSVIKTTISREDGFCCHLNCFAPQSRFATLRRSQYSGK